MHADLSTLEDEPWDPTWRRLERPDRDRDRRALAQGLRDARLLRAPRAPQGRVLKFNDDADVIEIVPLTREMNEASELEMQLLEGCSLVAEGCDSQDVEEPE